MKKISTLLILAFTVSTFFIASCDDDDGGDVDNCLTGTVRFTNTSNNPYDLYINNDYRFRLSGNTFREIDLAVGQYTARAEQVSGFIFFSTIVETELNVFGCQESEWVFP